MCYMTINKTQVEFEKADCASVEQELWPMIYKENENFLLSTQ